MNRTLFTPAMIETFAVCRRAYDLAFVAGALAGNPNQPRKLKMSTICKRFLLKALADIHRGRLTNMQSVQRFLGQHWPNRDMALACDAVGQDDVINAFRFAYRALSSYVKSPYKPHGSSVAAVNLKVRARVPHVKVYLEDTFDLVLWHPDTKTLELVDFHLNPLKPFDPAWPGTTLLVRHYLAQRLQVRWPFENLLFTYARIGENHHHPQSFTLDEGVCHLHWLTLVEKLEAMKAPQDFAPNRNPLCKHCQFLSQCIEMGQEATPAAKEEDGHAISRSA